MTNLGNLKKIDNFLGGYDLPVLNWDEMNNLNRSIISNKIETIINIKNSNLKCPKPDPDRFKLYQAFEGFSIKIS